MSLIKSIRSVYLDFQSKSGNYVFWASIVGKLLSFAASWIALQLVEHDELGEAIYAFTIVAFLVPFAGLGVFQSLLRFGSRLSSSDEKKGMFLYTMKYGIVGSLLLGLVVILSADLITAKMPNSAFYLRAFTAMLISSFLLECIKIQFRIEHNNKAFAMADMAYSVCLVILVGLGSYFYGALGYTLGFIFSPFIVAMLGLTRLDLRNKTSYKKEKGFWSYGIFSSLGNVTTELLIAIDILLIGNILQQSELVTAYKYVSMIPFSLLFLSHVYMATHFVNLTERLQDKSFVGGFIRNYLKVFGVICLGIVAVAFLLKEYVLQFLDQSYSIYTNEFMILIAGICGILLLRGLFGNLLSVIGKAQANFLISLLALGLNLILNYKLIPKYEIMGAAITSASVMWFTAILSVSLFYFYYRKV